MLRSDCVIVMLHKNSSLVNYFVSEYTFLFYYFVLNSFKPKRATADHTDNDFLVIYGLDMSIKINS